MSDPDAQQPDQPDQPVEPEEQARAVEAEELVAFARDLEAEEPRQRRAPVRRRGRVIHEGEVLDAEAHQPVRVRSESEEPAGSDPDEQDADEHVEGLLDASGAVIGGEAPAGSGAAGPGSAGGGSAGGGSAGHGAAGGGAAGPGSTPLPAGAASPAPDAAAFLALAVRTYLDGVDRYGLDSEITGDRLAQLRATLALYQGRAG